jgi:5'-deoxynucleotidase YfbR-like HD superfamily hydrolase
MKDKFWIETISGKRFDLARPNPKDVDIKDIACALSKTARFNGHTRGLLSVAQHLINTAELLKEWGEPVEVQLGGFTHDFPEAYIHDVSRPLKDLLGPVYRRIEAKIDAAIMKGLKLDRVLCLTKEQWKTIKRADNVLLITERRDFKAKTNWHYHKSHCSPDVKAWTRRLRPMSWWHAEALFLATYVDLKKRL